MSSRKPQTTIKMWGYADFSLGGSEKDNRGAGTSQYYGNFKLVQGLGRRFYE